MRGRPHQRRRHRVAWLLVVAGLSAALTACSASTSHAGRARAAGVTLPLAAEFTVHTATGSRHLGVPLVKIRVGDDRAIWVALDTGSVGLRVLAGTIPLGTESGIALSDHRDVEHFADGTVLRGAIAHAAIHVGRLTTTSPIPFQLVTGVHCTSRQPHCPRLEFGGDRVVSGVMGIGLYGNPGHPTNPLVSLPRPYDRGWSIMMHRTGGSGSAAGLLKLDAAVTTQASRTFDLSPDGNAQPGAPAWDDKLFLCLRVGIHKQCGPTLLDTGTTDIYVSGFPHTTHTHYSVVPAGQPVTLSRPRTTRPIWSFRSGNVFSVNRILAKRAGIQTVNTGVSIFYSTRVTYDPVDGYMSIG
jgi:hypothetical protein